MAVNWLELAAPNSTVTLDNYALTLNNNFNYTGGMVYEAENTFTVEFMVKPKVAHQIDVESTSGTGGTDGQKYVMFPVQGGSEADSRAGMGISVGTNGVSVYEHADDYMPALLVWEYPIDTVWTHVAVVYHNGKPSLYINGVWKKDGLQSLKQHVYPGTQFPGGYYGSQGDGILDEVRIWSVARTPAQIAANKDGELTGPQTGLVGYWPMNEGTGLVLHDVSGSGRDVDLTSAGYTSASWTNGRYSVASIIGSYRYAFNGKELDNDINGDDYDFGARIYDARLGRFLSVDKLSPKYAELTPYSFVGSMPLVATDIGGYYIYYVNSEGEISKLTADLKNLTQASLKAGIQALTSLTLGSTEWNKYQKDPNKHIILFLQTFADDDQTTLARTYGDIGTYKSKKYNDKNNKIEDKLTLFLSVFDKSLKDVDTDIDFKPTDVFNSVGINKNEIANQNNLANTLFHEIKAHITGQIKNSVKEQEEHYNFGLLPVYDDQNKFQKYVTLDNSSAYNYALEAFNKLQPKDQDPIVSKIMLSQFRKSLNVVSAEEFKKYYDDIQVKKPITPPPNNQ